MPDIDTELDEAARIKETLIERGLDHPFGRMFRGD
jgi:hypothetical protein